MHPSVRILHGWRGAALLTGLVLLAYAGRAPAAFIYDDIEGIQENPVINGDLPPTAAFTRDFWGRTDEHSIGAYRPVPVLLSSISWRLGGGTPFVFRAVSIALHLAVVVSAFFVFSTMVPVPVAWLAAAFAGVCAATSEAVLCHVGNADVICALASILGLAAHRRRGFTGAVGATFAFLIAVGSKETGVMAPLVWCLFDVLIPPSTSWFSRGRRFALDGVALIPYFLARSNALGALVPRPNGPMYNPLSTIGFFARELGAANIFVTRYVVGLVLPQRRLFDCSSRACGPASISDPVAWLGLAVWILLLTTPFLLRRRAPIAAAGLAWFVLFFLPASNFVVAGPTIYGERLLYTPVLGLSLAGAVGVFATMRSVGTPLVASVMGLLIAANVLSDRVRLIDWSSTEALTQSGVEYAEDSAIVQLNLAVLARPKKDYVALEQHARRAIEIYSDFMPPHRELAAALYMTGRMEEARREFQLAYSMNQDESLVFDYASFLAHEHKYEEGMTVVREYLSKHPRNPELRSLMTRLQRAQESAP